MDRVCGLAQDLIRLMQNFNLGGLGASFYSTYFCKTFFSGHVVEVRLAGKGVLNPAGSWSAVSDVRGVCERWFMRA
jgi:hypothetical protein